jgi:thioredoxin 1
MRSLKIFKHKQKGYTSNKNDYSIVEWPDYVVTLEEKNIKEFIQKYSLSIVDFWAPWCATCKVIAPRIRLLSKIYKGRVAFGKINIQVNQDIAKEYKIIGIPHLMFFKNGKKVNSITGVKSVGYIKDVIDNLLEK